MPSIYHAVYFDFALCRFKQLRVIFAADCCNHTQLSADGTSCVERDFGTFQLLPLPGHGRWHGGYVGLTKPRKILGVYFIRVNLLRDQSLNPKFLTLSLPLLHLVRY